MCSHRLIATTIVNPPELNFGQEVFYRDPQTLQYDLGGMHKLTPKSGILWMNNSIWTLKTNTFESYNFFRYAHL
jgi:hypothetical protein